MSKRIAHALVVTAVSAVFGSVTAYADSGETSIISANNEVGIAAVGTLMNYQEHITPGPSDTESGWMPGFAVKYSLMGDYFQSLPSNIYFAVHYQFNSGNINYKGALQTGTPYDSTDNATTNRVLARLGKGFVLTDQFMLTPYLAGGYQSWNRDLKGPHGYTEDYNAGLVGAGAMLQYAASQRLVLGANLEMLAVIDGGMTAHYPISVIYAPTQSFGTSGEEKVGASADYRLDHSWHLYGGLSYTHFNYTGSSGSYLFYDSIPIATYREPLSSTNLFSIDAGIAYQF